MSEYLHKYIFRREDNGELIYVDFLDMIQQDSIGCIRLPNGVVARRCIHLEQERDREQFSRKKGSASSVDKPIVSDALGFTEHQFADFESDRVKHGFTGIEFVRDPLVPEFFQVKCSGPDEHRRYVEHRGMTNQNSRNGSGAMLSEAQMDSAKQAIQERYGKPAKK